MIASVRRKAPAVFLAVCVLLAVTALVLAGIGSTAHTPVDSGGLAGLAAVAFAVTGTVFAAVGALILARLPGQAIGRLLAGLGASLLVADVTIGYADVALFVHPGGLPGGRLAAWFQNIALTPTFGVFALVLALFPDGRVTRRRLAAVVVLVLGSAMVMAAYAFKPGPIDPPFETVRNPVGIAGASNAFDGSLALGYLVLGLSIILAAVGMVRRLRRAHGIEREQLKWIASAAAVTGLSLPLTFLSYLALPEGGGGDEARNLIQLAGLTTVPVAAGFAILRHRLYDIDVVINRALVYGALTAGLAALYTCSILVLQLALNGITAGSDLAIAASTLAVAGAFAPARRRIQTSVDRRFYRRRYDAERTLAHFAVQTRDEVDLVVLSDGLQHIVGEAMQPTHVSIWLKP